MNDPPPETWALPDLLLWDGSDWASYEERVYAIFRADFVDARATWRGQRVTVQREPLLNGKEEGFWHLVTETGPTGKPDDRLPDLERCARIRWVRALVAAPSVSVRTFGQKRGTYSHIGIVLPDFSYVVFLRQWPANVQLKAAYHVDGANQRDRLRKQWEADMR